MQARVGEILSVGTELLLGEIVDTNAAWLAGQLRDRGIYVYYKSTVGDNLERLRETIVRALERSDLVILSGGLGPTEGDLTRSAIAAVVGEEPREDPALLATLEALFSTRRRPMAANNRKQAWLIPSARPLDNPIGTAPGWWVEHQGKIIIALPGPPHEMQRMWSEQVVPRLPPTPTVLFHTMLHSFGVGESDLAHRLADFTRLANPTLATYAKRHGVDIRIAAGAESAEEARRLADPVIREVEARFGLAIYGRDEETLPGVIGRLLLERGQTVAVMESVTGGLVADLLTDVPGASAWFLGGLVAYTLPIKKKFGVRPESLFTEGVVSEAVALELADAARETMGCDWGLACTGVAGPALVDGHPPGLAWLAVAGPDGHRTRVLSWFGQRRQIKERVANSLLMLFFRTLHGEQSDPRGEVPVSPGERPSAREKR